MNAMSTTPFNQAAAPALADETTLLKKQLIREIACLERQLERVRAREEFAEYNTLETYEDMIESRRKMLNNLPWSD